MPYPPRFGVRPLRGLYEPVRSVLSVAAYMETEELPLRRPDGEQQVDGQVTSTEVKGGDDGAV